MRFYSNENIVEGRYWPAAWIWKGKAFAFNWNSRYTSFLVIRLPWWTRQERAWFDGSSCTFQPAFIVAHKAGQPETYRLQWMPVPQHID